MISARQRRSRFRNLPKLPSVAMCALGAFHGSREIRFRCFWSGSLRKILLHFQIPNDNFDGCL